jgi:hypothetical protein
LWVSGWLSWLLLLRLRSALLFLFCFGILGIITAADPAGLRVWDRTHIFGLSFVGLTDHAKDYSISR